MTQLQKVNIRALAELARLEVSDGELKKLEKEIPAILEFVKTIQQVAGDAKEASPQLHNVTRADENPHESGIYTKKLLEAAPARKGNRITVRQVITRKEKK